MSWFRVPARALFLANLAGSVLAGLGVDTLQTRMAEPQAWRKLAGRFFLIAVTVLAILLMIRHAHEADGSSRTAAASRRVLEDGRFWLTLGAMTVLILVASFARSSRIPHLAGGLLGLVALCELGWCGFSLIRVAPAERFLGGDAIGAALLRHDRDPQRAGRLRIKARDSFYSDLQAASLGIEKTNINDVFQLDHAARLYEVLYPVASRPRRRWDDSMSEAIDDYRRQLRQAVFDRMSVAYLVSDRIEADPGWQVAAQGDSQGSHWVIQANLSALPRAYVVPSAEIIAEKASLTLARFREVDPRKTVFMNLDPLRAIPAELRQPFTAAEWSSVDPDHLVLKVTIDAPGLLVITDTWMPGWTARVDGEPTPILEGNLAQRVVPLWRRGHHTIALDYHAPGLTLGCTVTALSFLTWGLVCGFRFRARSRTKVVAGRTAGRGLHSKPRVLGVAG